MTSKLRLRRRQIVERDVAAARRAGRRAPNGAARRCRARNPGRTGGSGCRRAGSSRRPAPRPSTSRCLRPSRSSCGACRGSARWSCARRSPAGTSVSFLPISFSVLTGTAVLPRRCSSWLSARAQARPGAVEPVGLVGLVGLAGLALRFEVGAPVGLHLLDLGLGDQALADQLVGIDLHGRLAGCGCLRYMIGWVNAGSSPSLWPKRR